MSYKKFELGDLFYNTIKAKPRFEFKIHNGNIYLNNLKDGLVVLNSLNISPEMPIIPFVSCSLPYSLDFSCPDNTYYLGII